MGDPFADRVASLLDGQLEHWQVDLVRQAIKRAREIEEGRTIHIPDNTPAARMR